MKKYFALSIIGLLLLTSCSLKIKISREDFIKKAENTTKYDYQYATVQCKGYTESISEAEGTSTKSSINRSINFARQISVWKLANNDKALNNFEKSVSDSCSSLLKTTIREEIKKEPISKEDTDGLVFYTNPLSYLYKVHYKNAVLKLTYEGQTITARVTGDETSVYKYNKDNGNIAYYFTSSSLTMRMSVNGKSIKIDNEAEMKMIFTYSDEN